MTGPVYRWLVVAMLWLVCFFNYADRQAIFSVFPLLEKEMQLNDTQLGVVGGSFMWVYAAAAPLAGMVGDRWRRKTLILVGLIFWSLITIATAVSTRYWHLVLFRSLEGFGEAFYFPASMSLLSDYHGPATRSRAMAIHQSSVYVGTVVGGSLSGLLAEKFHWWGSSFLLFGSSGLVLGLVLIGALREPARTRSPAPAGAPETPPGGSRGGSGFLAATKEVFGNRMVLLLMAVFFGANFVAGVFLTWMPTFLFRKFGMTLSLAGFSGTIYQQAGSILGVLLGGVLADRLARRYPGGRMAAQALGLLFGVPFVFLTGWTLSVTTLVLAMSCFGFMKGMYDSNIWASLHDVVRPERRASAVGWMNGLAWVGGGLAAVTIGAASERFTMSACISATSLIYLAFGLLLVGGIVFHTKARARAAVGARELTGSHRDA